MFQILKFKYQILRIAAIACLFAVMFSACADPRPFADRSATRSVTDDIGRTVTLPLELNRAISLAPSVTEAVFAVGAGDRLVGVTTFCDYPEAAKSIAKIGDTMNPNMETIVALRPEIVFVSTASQVEAFTRTLQENGIAVYVTNPESLSDVLKNLTRLGELFDTPSLAEAKVAALRSRAAAARSAMQGSERVGVFVQISKEPLFTIGKQSFLTELLESASARSLTADVETAYPKLSKETALALNPEAIILSDSEDNREPNEVFRNTPAVRNGRIYRVNADLLSRPGPRLVDALEVIAKSLHPDKFPK